MYARSMQNSKMSLNMSIELKNNSSTFYVISGPNSVAFRSIYSTVSFQINPLKLHRNVFSHFCNFFVVCWGLSGANQLWYRQQIYASANTIRRKRIELERQWIRLSKMTLLLSSRQWGIQAASSNWMAIFEKATKFGKQFRIFVHLRSKPYNIGNGKRNDSSWRL